MIVAVLLLSVAVLTLGTAVVILWQRRDARAVSDDLAITALRTSLGHLAGQVASMAEVEPENVLTRRERKQWVITLKSGEAFRGVLTDHDDGCVVLSNAEHYADPTTPVPVDGEVVVLLSDIKYAQRP